MWKKLSHKLSENTPTFGSREPIKKEYVRSLKRGDECNTQWVEFYTHASTHIDAPYHFNETGKKVDELSLEDLNFRRPCIVDVERGGNEFVTIDDLRPFFSSLSKCDFLMIRTGHEKYREDFPQKFIEGPGLSIELAEWLVSEFPNIEGLGIDFASISSISELEIGYKVHNTLLNPNEKSRDPIIIVEDMHLSSVNKDPVQIWIVPFYIEGLDGAPCTILAEFRES